MTVPAPSWGLARLSQKNALVEGGPYEYTYDSSAGEGIRVYIVDTGILAEHDVCFSLIYLWGWILMASRTTRVVRPLVTMLSPDLPTPTRTVHISFTSLGSEVG